MSIEIKTLEAERTAIMAQKLTHAEWVKAMERLAEISAELLLLRTEGAQEIEEAMTKTVPPIASAEQRATARIKLIALNKFRKEITHETI